MTTPAKVELHFRVTTDEDNILTAVCKEFPGLITCAATVDRLLVPMIRDAVVGWLDVLKERGTLGDELARLGTVPNVDEILFRTVLTDDEEIHYDVRAAS